MDPEMQKKLLSDPAVQEAMKKAGTDALNDPAVQNQIIATAKEKFPQYAAQAQEQVTAWASDPAVQAKAKEYAGIAGQMAGQYAGQALEKGLGLVEQGPTGVRILAFGAGVVSCVNAVMMFLDISNLLHIVNLVVSGYLVVFALTTMIFEAPPWLIEKIPVITGYQDMLMEKAKFISEVLGRGLFYIFQGSLWLCFASLARMLDLVAGGALVFVGFLHVAMHFGGLGEVAQKMRQGYASISGGAGQP